MPTKKAPKPPGVSFRHKLSSGPFLRPQNPRAPSWHGGLRAETPTPPLARLGQESSLFHFLPRASCCSRRKRGSSMRGLSGAGSSGSFTLAGSKRAGSMGSTR